MTKEDVAEHIAEQLAEPTKMTAEDFEGRLCCYCGEMVPWDDLVTWDIQIHEAPDWVARNYFCSEECKRDSMNDAAFNKGEKTYYGEHDEIKKEDLDDDC